MSKKFSVIPNISGSKECNNDISLNKKSSFVKEYIEKIEDMITLNYCDFCETA
jgi:hypothetical protein